MDGARPAARDTPVRLIEAIQAIDSSKRSLITLAVLSGKTEAVKWVIDNLILKHFGQEPSKVIVPLCFSNYWGLFRR